MNGLLGRRPCMVEFGENLHQVLEMSLVDRELILGRHSEENTQ